MEMIRESLTGLGVVVLCGALSIATVYVSLYMKKLSEKAKAEAIKLQSETQKELVNKAIYRTNQLVTTNVIRAQETLVKEIKDKAKDNNIDKRDLQEVALKVKENVLNQLSNEVQELVTTEIQDINKYIEAQIEVSLATLKKQI